jgi:mono/diheme cytochrome c family protein
MRVLRNGKAQLVFVLCWSTLAPAAWAQNISGETDYRVGCAPCHGRDGKGNGPLASELRTPPPNLTLLEQQNGGVFPASALEDIIDGRRSLRAHGGSEMPIWGNIFFQLQPDRAQDRIQRIVEYLKTIQAP